MTVKDVRRRLELIAEKAKHDAESAHGWEDDLYCAVLVAIADGSTKAKELASEALKARDIEFPRWCA